MFFLSMLQEMLQEIKRLTNLLCRPFYPLSVVVCACVCVSIQCTGYYHATSKYIGHIGRLISNYYIVNRDSAR